MGDFGIRSLNSRANTAEQNAPATIPVFRKNPSVNQDAPSVKIGAHAPNKSMPSKYGVGIPKLFDSDVLHLDISPTTPNGRKRINSMMFRSPRIIPPVIGFHSLLNAFLRYENISEMEFVGCVSVVSFFICGIVKPAETFLSFQTDTYKIESKPIVVIIRAPVYVNSAGNQTGVSREIKLSHHQFQV